MGAVLGQLLPYAIGVAISPVPIIAVILMLLSPQARGASIGFMTGWLAGIVIVTTVFLLLAGAVDSSTSDPSTVVSWVKLVLGVLLFGLAFRRFLGRPREGQEAQLPKWMGAIDKMTPGRALALGAALSALNPKNLSLSLAAGGTIGAASLGVGGDVIAVAVFTVLAGCSVAVPVIAYLIAADRMRGPLDRLRIWLVQENAVVMAVLLVVFGTVLIGNGISGVT